MPQTPTFADLEVRIRSAADNRYRVDLKLDGEGDYGGHVEGNILSRIEGISLLDDAKRYVIAFAKNHESD